MKNVTQKYRKHTEC